MIPFYLGIIPLLLFPHIPLSYLAPFILLQAVDSSKLRSLWIAAGCGLIVDIIAGDGPLGVCAASYTLAMLLLYHYRRTHIALLTIYFSSLSTLCAAMLLLRFSIITDLILLPCLDGLYALVWFTLPLWALYGRKPRPRPYVKPRPS